MLGIPSGLPLPSPLLGRSVASGPASSLHVSACPTHPQGLPPPSLIRVALCCELRPPTLRNGLGLTEGHLVELLWFYWSGIRNCQRPLEKRPSSPVEKHPTCSVRKCHPFLGPSPASTDVPVHASVDTPIYRALALVLAKVGIPAYVSVDAPLAACVEPPRPTPP